MADSQDTRIPSRRGVNDNHHPWTQRVPERLAETRRRLRLSEREMADAMGVCLRTYRRYESVRGPRSVLPLMELADFIERVQPKARPLFFNWIGGMSTPAPRLKPILKVVGGVRG